MSQDQPKARLDPSRREMRRTAQIIPYIWEPVVCNCEHECEWEFGGVVEMPDLPAEITIRPKRPGARYFAFKLGYHERKDRVYGLSNYAKKLVVKGWRPKQRRGAGRNIRGERRPVHQTPRSLPVEAVCPLCGCKETLDPGTLRVEVVPATKGLLA